MPTIFVTRTKETTGFTSLIVRCQSFVHGINYRMASGLEVDVKAWKNSKKSPKTLKNFIDANPELWAKMEKIRLALDDTLKRDTPPTKEEVRTIIDSIVFAEARAAQQKRKEAKAKAEEEAKRITLNKYIEMFKEQVASGARQTDQGKNYSKSTVTAIKQALKQFDLYQDSIHRKLDFKDINMVFYYNYTAFLKNKNYSVNSVGKCIRQLKAIMNAAEAEGYHNNVAWKDKRFKGARVEVDNIYLTQEDLDKMMKVDMSKLSTGHEQARDIFMVGVWTAQRISDYNNIKKEDFSTITKKVIKEAPDPENPFVMKDYIETEEVTFLNIRQQKTGAKVAIPCKSELKAILEKYDYQMPHLEDQVINRYIKDVAKEAGINDIIEIETTKGGTPKKEKFEKWQLVHSHTARRTGATLMYLAGVDVYEIMKITGHTTPKMLKKYIKADTLEVVQKLTDKYDYFR